MAEHESGLEAEDFISEVREKFKRAAEWEEDNRLCAIDDIKFARRAEQWPPEVAQAREGPGKRQVFGPRGPAQAQGPQLGEGGQAAGVGVCADDPRHHAGVAAPARARGADADP